MAETKKVKTPQDFMGELLVAVACCAARIVSRMER
jgi:hypothetical protein